MEETGNLVRKEEPIPNSHFRILLDARKIGDGGIGTYIKNLIHALNSVDGVNLSIMCDPAKARSAGIGNNVQVLAESAGCYSIDEYFFMPTRIPFKKYDVFHVPHYTLPYGVPIPTVITVHDLIHIYSPERFYYPWFIRPLIQSALKRATRIVTVSEASCQQIKKFVKQELSIVTKLRVVPNVVNADLIQHSLFEDTEDLNPTRKGDYFLAVFSNSKPHKGLDDLIECYSELQDENSKRGEAVLNKRLVLVGPGTERIKGKNFGSEAGAAAEIIALGEVSQNALRRLYAQAAALIVPSTAEGFCLPVLEAHSLGIPVIARPVPAILELITSYDIVCSDFSKAALKAAIFNFLSADSEEPAKVGEFRKQMERYAPQTAAEGMLAIYAEAKAAACGGVI